ncbi:chitin synthase-domain-containing protein [Lactarius sanguifluus]|nr:chitin synthase-domain-containing protein [Lactarius sanguifluus]
MVPPSVCPESNCNNRHFAQLLTTLVHAPETSYSNKAQLPASVLCLGPHPHSPIVQRCTASPLAEAKLRLARKYHDNNNIRYGRIPQRVPRRNKALKLFHGNFVIDPALPTKLLNLCAYKDERELMHTMRYSTDNSSTLRQVHYDPPHRTEPFIDITMYIEDDTLFACTMHGVMKNIAYLLKRDRSNLGQGLLEEGRRLHHRGWPPAEINSRTLSAIAAYQERIATDVVSRKPVSVHIYEYFTQIAITKPNKIECAAWERRIVFVQVIFCLKEKNEMINSHRWFFNAFGRILQPNGFDRNSNVGDTCGEIVAFKGKYGQTLLNPLLVWLRCLRTTSNTRCRSSLTSRIHCRASGTTPVEKHGTGADIFTANKYLAEGRILCWVLMFRRGGSWVLHYVQSAHAVTDTPDQVGSGALCGCISADGTLSRVWVPELVSQWRRWLNGSFFAAIHGTVKLHYIYRSSHSFKPKSWIHVELTYQTFNLVFSWFTLGFELFNTLLREEGEGLRLVLYPTRITSAIPAGPDAGALACTCGLAQTPPPPPLKLDAELQVGLALAGLRIKLRVDEGKVETWLAAVLARLFLELWVSAQQELCVLVLLLVELGVPLHGDDELELAAGHVFEFALEFCLETQRSPDARAQGKLWCRRS